MSKLILSLAAVESDEELATEDRCREDAVRAVVGNDYWVTNDGLTVRPPNDKGWFAAKPVSDLSSLPVYGRLPTNADALRPVADRLADRYHLLETFHRHAGRQTVVASYGSGDKTLVEAAWGILATTGAVRIKVMAKAKYATWVLDNRDGSRDLSSRLSVERCLWEEAGFALEHLSDQPGAFLVQAEVPIRYEYRLFVVGHRVVTGAGCIDAHTPVNNDGGAFDHKVQFVRGGGGDCAVIHKPGVIEDFIRFGTEVAAELAVEQPAMSEYVLDVAYIGEGLNVRQGIVEFNGLCNSGLYASQPRRVVEALVADRG